jgi:peptide/nickel transport system substrate-binding protein
MKHWSKDILVRGLIFLMLIFISMPGITTAKEKAVAIANGHITRSLDPAGPGSTSNPSIMLHRNIYQSLLRFKFNSAEIEGDLAESWSISQDGLVYTFKLRDNVQWHKGFGKVTAHDVKFSLDRIMDPKTKSPFIGELGSNIKEIKVVDDFAVEIHLKRRDTAFLLKCIRPRPFAIVSQKAVEQYGKDFGTNPIGSGPFVFQSMDQEKIIFTANKEYFEGPPKIDKVIYKGITDKDTQILALAKGDINVIWGFGYEKTDADRIKASGCKIKAVNIGMSHLCWMNPQVKPLGDIRIRRAIAHAINKDEIVTYVLNGMGEKLGSLVPKGYFGHTEQGIPRYDYDPQKAKELLAEAGYPNGFEVRFDTPHTAQHLPIAIALQGQLAKVGIKANLEVTDMPAWMKKMTSAKCEMTILNPTRPPDADPILTSFYTSAGFSPGINFMRYNKLDKEIAEAREEMDKTKRQRMYYEIQKRLMEDLPGIPLCMMYYPLAYQPNIGGLQDRDPMQAIDFYRIHFVDEK